MDKLENERNALRAELHFLKSCQLKYFLLSVSASGVVNGFANNFDKNVPNIIYLVPLLVIIPCWWIFFDKATTITRIVGYYRIIEGIIQTNSSSPYYYLGWENSLNLFRKKQHDVKIRERIVHFSKGIMIGLTRGLLFRTTQRYWVINWLTFLCLGLTSFYLGFPESNILKSPMWYVLALIFIISFLHNLSVLGKLIDGQNSYSNNFSVWKEILKSIDAKNYFNDVLGFK